MKKIMLFTISTLLSMPMISLPMARFASSKWGKSAFVSLAALTGSKLSGWFGPDDEEKYLPQIPTHPSYPYDEEGIAFEHLCLQSPSVIAKEYDGAKERKARELAQEVHDILPGSKAHRKQKYPFEEGGSFSYYLIPGRWNDRYQYSTKKDNHPWWEKKPLLKPEDIYATQIPGKEQISAVQATIEELSTACNDFGTNQSFKPSRQRFEEALKKDTTALDQEKDKYFWQYDERKMQSLERNIKDAQRLITQHSILGSTREEVALLKAAGFIRKGLLEKHLKNHFEWEKEKNEIEKQREEIKERRKEVFDTWACCTN